MPQILIGVGGLVFFRFLRRVLRLGSLSLLCRILRGLCYLIFALFSREGRACELRIGQWQDVLDPQILRRCVQQTVNGVAGHRVNHGRIGKPRIVISVVVLRADQDGRAFLTAGEGNDHSLFIVQLPFAQRLRVCVGGRQVVPRNRLRVCNQRFNLIAVQRRIRAGFIPQLVGINRSARFPHGYIKRASDGETLDLRNGGDGLHCHQILLGFIEGRFQRGCDGINRALLARQAEIIAVGEGRSVAHAVGCLRAVRPACGYGKGGRFQTVVRQARNVLQLSGALQFHQRVRHRLHGALQHRPFGLIIGRPGIVAVGKGIRRIARRPAQPRQILDRPCGQFKAARGFRYGLRFVKLLYAVISTQQNCQSTQHQDHFLSALHRRFLLI